MKNQYDASWYYIAIAFGSVFGKGPNNYGPPSSIQTYDSDLSSCFGELREGGIVVDKRAIGYKLWDFILKDPTMNASLPDHHVKRTIWPGIGGHIVKYQTLKISNPFEINKNTDEIALDLHCEIWRAWGARIGRKEGNFIVWENGEKTPVVPYDQRYSVKDTWIPENWDKNWD